MSQPETAELADLADALVAPGHPLSSQLRRDPYPLYDRLREADPLYQTSDGRWIATSYDLADAVMRDGRWSRESTTPEEEMSLAVRVFMRSVVFRDPPDHTRLRRSVSPLFTPKAIALHHEIVSTRVREVLTAARDEPTFNFCKGPAYRLPVLIIGDLLGLPPDDVEDFDLWAHTLRQLDEHAHEGEALDNANKAAATAVAFFEDVISSRRRNPGNDIVSWMLESEGSDNSLNSEEISGLCLLLHIGGHGTTNDLIGNGMLQLLRDPESHERLRANPSLVPGAVEEMLRFDTVIQASLPRIAPVDLEFAGKTIAEGETVTAVMGAANRDPNRFDNPNHFDIERDPNHHLSFASGIHFCLGASLARLETQEFFRQLLAEHPPLKMAVEDEDLQWMDSFLHRGLDALPVAWVE